MVGVCLCVCRRLWGYVWGVHGMWNMRVYGCVCGGYEWGMCAWCGRCVGGCVLAWGGMRVGGVAINMDCGKITGLGPKGKGSSPGFVVDWKCNTFEPQFSSAIRPEIGANYLQSLFHISNSKTPLPHLSFCPFPPSTQGCRNFVFGWQKAFFSNLRKNCSIP